MPRVTLYIPDDLKARMDEVSEAVNWSAIAQQAFREVVINLAARKETATMDDVVERLRASKQSYVETEHKAGLAVGEEWAKEAAKYGELLRIAKAVEEARREIDVQTLQDLIDPEHKMDPGDWGSFWEDRGFSGDAEPSDVWVRAFADGCGRQGSLPPRTPGPPSRSTRCPVYQSEEPPKAPRIFD